MPDRRPSDVSTLIHGDELVLPDSGARIPVRELRFTFTRSGGPGGQNVNKVATRVTLWFDVVGTASLDEAQRARVRTVLATRIGADGRLRVASSKHRTQSANRRATVVRFIELVDAALTPEARRRPTRVPRGSRHRRLADKQARSKAKQLRRPPAGDA